MLQVKTLRLLQYFPPPADASTLRTLNELLRKIIRGVPQQPAALILLFNSWVKAVCTLGWWA
jgi:hypothetical protein